MVKTPRTVSVVTDQIIKKCEETGEFVFNSRNFSSVGEYGLAFDGIFRFVEGNPAFMSELGEDYTWLKETLCPNKDFSRHTLLKWGSGTE